MFCKVDFRDDERKKKNRENEKGKLFRECLVERRGGENDGGAQKKGFFPKWGENLVGKI